jgi:hypothetical protein
MKYTFEMGSGAIIYIPSFIKFGSYIQKLIGDELIRLVPFFKIRGSRLKKLVH